MLEEVFVYWTLMREEVQEKNIWRRVEWVRDSLFWYKKVTIWINWNIYPIIVIDTNSIDSIKWIVISVSKEELIKLDKYETSAYIRKKITLSSWKIVWAYQQ